MTESQAIEISDALKDLLLQRRISQDPEELNIGAEVSLRLSDENRSLVENVEAAISFLIIHAFDPSGQDLNALLDQLGELCGERFEDVEYQVRSPDLLVLNPSQRGSVEDPDWRSMRLACPPIDPGEAAFRQRVAAWLPPSSRLDDDNGNDDRPPQKPTQIGPKI